MRTLRFVALLTAIISASLEALAADQRDSAFVSSYGRGALDLNDLYVFRSPANANNTVIAITFGSFVEVKTKPVFSSSARYEIRIDTNFDGSTDTLITAQFGRPNQTGVQSVKVTRNKGLDAMDVIAAGNTGANVPIVGGGMLRAGIFDDPFFFDQAAFDAFFVQGKPGFPRAPGTAKNFYGPNANVLGIVLELPSATIAPSNTIVGVWARTMQRNLQLDRCGRPLVSPALIPRLPRNDTSIPDQRSTFNRGLPVTDVTAFTEALVHVLNTPDGLYHRTPSDAASLAALFLPDQLPFQIGNPNGYGTFVNGTVLGNGRRLSDDVIDVTLNLLKNGAITTDNVSDDNGLKVTDGSVDPVSGMTRAIAFPYLGTRNLAPGGPSL
jgi:hypothetical protein